MAKYDIELSTKLNIDRRQAQADLAKLNIGNLNTSNMGTFTRGIDTARVAVGNFNKTIFDADGITNSFAGRLGLTTGRLGAYALAATAFMGLRSVFASATTKMIAFDKAINQMSQLLGGNTALAKEHADTILSVARSYGTSATDLFSVANLLTQTSDKFKGANFKNAMEAFGKSTLVATFGDLKTTVNGTIGILEEFNLSGADTYRVLDLAAMASKKYAIAADDLFASIKVGGGTFAEAGGSIEQYVAALTTLKSATRTNTSAAAANLKMIATRSVTPDVIFKQESLTRGVGGIRDANGELLSFMDRMQRIADATRGFSQTQKMIIAQQMSSITQYQQLLTLWNDLQNPESKYKATMAGADKGVGGLNRAAVVSMDQVGKPLEKITATFDTFVTKISQDKAIKTLVQNFSDLTRTVIDAASAVSSILPTLIRIGAVVASVYAVKNIGSFGGGTVKFFRMGAAEKLGGAAGKVGGMISEAAAGVTMQVFGADGQPKDASAGLSVAEKKKLSPVELKQYNQRIKTEQIVALETARTQSRLDKMEPARQYRQIKTQLEEKRQEAIGISGLMAESDVAQEKIQNKLSATRARVVMRGQLSRAVIAKISDKTSGPLTGPNPTPSDNRYAFDRTFRANKLSSYLGTNDLDGLEKLGIIKRDETTNKYSVASASAVASRGSRELSIASNVAKTRYGKIAPSSYLKNDLLSLNNTIGELEEGARIIKSDIDTRAKFLFKAKDRLNKSVRWAERSPKAMMIAGVVGAMGLDYFGNKMASSYNNQVTGMNDDTPLNDSYIASAYANAQKRKTGGAWSNIASATSMGMGVGTMTMNPWGIAAGAGIGLVAGVGNEVINHGDDAYTDATNQLYLGASRATSYREGGKVEYEANKNLYSSKKSTLKDVFDWEPFSGKEVGMSDTSVYKEISNGDARAAYNQREKSRFSKGLEENHGNAALARASVISQSTVENMRADPSISYMQAVNLATMAFNDAAIKLQLMGDVTEQYTEGMNRADKIFATASDTIFSALEKTSDISKKSALGFEGAGLQSSFRQGLFSNMTGKGSSFMLDPKANESIIDRAFNNARTSELGGGNPFGELRKSNLLSPDALAMTEDLANIGGALIKGKNVVAATLESATPGDKLLPGFNPQLGKIFNDAVEGGLALRQPKTSQGQTEKDRATRNAGALAVRDSEALREFAETYTDKGSAKVKELANIGTNNFNAAMVPINENASRQSEIQGMKNTSFDQARAFQTSMLGMQYQSPSQAISSLKGLSNYSAGGLMNASAGLVSAQGVIKDKYSTPADILKGWDQDQKDKTTKTTDAFSNLYSAQRAYQDELSSSTRELGTWQNVLSKAKEQFESLLGSLKGIGGMSLSDQMMTGMKARMGLQAIGGDLDYKTSGQMIEAAKDPDKLEEIIRTGNRLRFSMLPSAMASMKSMGGLPGRKDTTYGNLAEMSETAMGLAAVTSGQSPEQKQNTVRTMGEASDARSKVGEIEGSRIKAAADLVSSAAGIANQFLAASSTNEASQKALVTSNDLLRGSIDQLKLSVDAAKGAKTTFDVNGTVNINGLTGGVDSNVIASVAMLTAIRDAFGSSPRDAEMKGVYDSAINTLKAGKK